MFDPPGAQRRRYRSPYPIQQPEPADDPDAYGTWFRIGVPSPFADLAPRRRRATRTAPLVAAAGLLLATVVAAVWAAHTPSPAAPQQPGVVAAAHSPHSAPGPPAMVAPTPTGIPEPRTHMADALPRPRTREKPPAPRAARSAPARLTSPPERIPLRQPAARVKPRPAISPRHRPPTARRTPSPPSRRFDVPATGGPFSVAYACRHFSPRDWRYGYCARVWTDHKRQLGL